MVDRQGMQERFEQRVVAVTAVRVHARSRRAIESFEEVAISLAALAVGLALGFVAQLV